MKKRKLSFPYMAILPPEGPNSRPVRHECYNFGRGLNGHYTCTCSPYIIYI